MIRQMKTFSKITMLIAFFTAAAPVAVMAQVAVPGATQVQQAGPSLQQCDQTFTATAAGNATATVTTGTPPSGTVFYLCTVDINEIANAAVTGAAGPAEVCTTTNLINNLTWWGSNATMTAGQLTAVIALAPAFGAVKSVTPGTAFTIACSGGQSTYNVRVNITGFFAKP